MISVIYAQFSKMPDDWYTPKRIELFYSMVAHAELFDEEAGQPDCLDPEKAKFNERIEQLELNIEDDYKGADND
jgi:rubredoxin